ncbi:hypothetical protein [Leifsonia sp. NCR5]|uniref:hypothetical protein n=1 Tax=Leifsonia sp. NCR5 TaxID=1978342 RepID=UPI000A192643|nr:hypothetical protein [Leifsonia sp. NCR5]
MTTHVGPLNGLPIACTLTPASGKAQVEKWHDFDAVYALRVERTDTQLTVRYSKVEDSIRRLRDLVDDESHCCSFVNWTIDDQADDLKLIVTGTPEGLSALSIG